MGIDVVTCGLGVVLHDEHQRVGPKGLVDSPSTMRPVAWSLSAAVDASFGMSGLNPSVW
jgi:hypothetical protein